VGAASFSSASDYIYIIYFIQIRKYNGVFSVRRQTCRPYGLLSAAAVSVPDTAADSDYSIVCHPGGGRRPESVFMRVTNVAPFMRAAGRRPCVMAAGCRLCVFLHAGDSVAPFMRAADRRPCGMVF